MSVIINNVPLTKKEGMEKGDDSGVQLNFPCDKNLTQLLWFSKHLRTELEAPKCMTTEVQKGRAPQKYTSAPQEVYSNLASYTCRIYIYRDTMADLLLLKKVLSSETWAKRKMREREIIAKLPLTYMKLARLGRRSREHGVQRCSLEPSTSL